MVVMLRPILYNFWLLHIMKYKFEYECQTLYKCVCYNNGVSACICLGMVSVNDEAQ